MSQSGGADIVVKKGLLDLPGGRYYAALRI
jgi:hypothetical protein